MAVLWTGLLFMAVSVGALLIARTTPPPIPPVGELRILNLQRVDDTLRFKLSGIKQTSDAIQSLLVSYRFSDMSLIAGEPIVTLNGGGAVAAVRVLGERWTSTDYVTVLPDYTLRRLEGDMGVQMRLCFVYPAAAVPVTCWETPFHAIPTAQPSEPILPAITVPESLGH